MIQHLDTSVATLQSVSPLLEFIQETESSRLPSILRTLFDPAKLDADTLDVSELFPYATSSCVLKFHVLPSTIREEGRYYARLAIYLGKAPVTVQGHLRRLSSVFREAHHRFHVWDFRQLTFGQLSAIISASQQGAGEKSKTCTALRYFFMYMASFCGKLSMNMDLEALQAMERRLALLESSICEAGKTPDIDPDYFEALESELPLLAVRKDVPIEMRMTAGLLHLELHVGIRPLELVTLTTDRHIVKEGTNGRKTDYLAYEVHKLSHGGREKVMCQCYMLPGAVAAYELLLELRKEVEGHAHTDRLFIMPGKLAVNERRYRDCVEKLFLTYLPHLCKSSWNEIKRRSIKGRTYYIPSLMQYRVHLCSYLYRQGVRLHVIELGMSHLTDAMLAYYVRAEDRTFCMHQKRADNILLTRIGNDYAVDASGHKGDELLSLLPLSLSQLRVYQAGLERMTSRGYDYEVDRYTKLCRNKLITEVRPALSYLSRLVAMEGEEAVLGAYPSLRPVISEMDSLTNQLTIWEKQHKI